MARLWGLTNTTPGAIAASAMLVSDVSVSYTLCLYNDILLSLSGGGGVSFGRLVGHFRKTNNFKNVAFIRE